MSTESLPSHELRTGGSVDPGLPPTTRLIAENALDHPECVAWDAVEQCLLASGEDGHRLTNGVASYLGGWLLTAFDAPGPGLAPVRPGLPEVAAA